MRLSFNDRPCLRKSLVALAALAASITAAPTALARDGAGVIVASSSPSQPVGRVVEVGDMLRLESGAAVTILEQSGRVSTIVRSGAYRPTGASQARTGPSVVDSISALISSDRSVRAPGGVRTVQRAAECGAAGAEATFEGLERALAAQCDTEAVSILTHLVDNAGPPQLYVSLIHSRDGRGGVIGVQVQANFEAFLYCRLRRADSTLLAITPEPGALPMRVLASSSYAVTFPALFSETSGAVQCMAIGARQDSEAPAIGDWPRELDPQRAEQGARVAAVLLPIGPSR
jgi:hypothetical protein